MKRSEAKQKLIDLGIAEPTEEQITSLLDSVTAETKSEHDRAEKYKADAGKADDLQKQLDELQNQNLSDAEKAHKENEKLQQQIAELTANNLKTEAKAILKGAGLEDADIEALLPGMIADTVEDTQARANAYVSAMNKFRDNAIKEHDKEVLDGTRTPGGDGGDGGDDKPEDVANAEKINFGGIAKEAQTARDYYK